MHESIRLVREFVKGASFEDFRQNAMMYSACVRHLGIIGEAASRLTEGLRNNYPEIAWSTMIGMRNVIIHEYFGLDDVILWQTISDDLPALEIEIEAIIKKLEQQ
ncbi:MAG: DUF86 domain-containing protein [Saprospirales bacterium]|nr:DUF86 domain-containing protein [Saprospirales bacterium]MBK8920837.1 DUF86 domain-containing protein [Saprospirales bacterium]